MAESWLSRLLRRAPDPAARRRPPPPPVVAGATARAPTTSRTNSYQAVSVIACPQACAAACEAQGQRFLARQAPRLPLPGCDRPASCRCRFEKFADRRTAQQRSPYNNPHAIGYGGAEKRRNRGRRSTDR
ncbi:MAG: hypothetical protein MUF07_03645 [Steroidobacteraceae bacterium]|jgi:hypothetical protein|nr:hypothetical protein [Steroidobacteraceae bacterium]